MAKPNEDDFDTGTGTGGGSDSEAYIIISTIDVDVDLYKDFTLAYFFTLESGTARDAKITFTKLSEFKDVGWIEHNSIMESLVISAEVKALADSKYKTVLNTDFPELSRSRRIRIKFEMKDGTWSAKSYAKIIAKIDK